MKEVFRKKEDKLMKDVVAIVVTYNRKELLQQCIEKLQEQTYALDILVIDNASTDGTSELFVGCKDNVFYYNTGSNLGGAGGFNFGIKKAYDLGYDYFWLMDDDTLPYPDALEKLMAVKCEIKEFGFLSSVVEWVDGSLCNMNIQRTGLKAKKLDFNVPTNKIIMATFVSFFMSRNIVESVGLPIAEFIIWSDDLEYSRRISKQYPCYLVTSSKVLHKMGSNAKVGIESESADRLWRYKLMYRNEVYVFRREGLKGWFYLISRMLVHTFRIIIKARDNRKGKLALIWKSFFDGIKFQPKVERV